MVEVGSQTETPCSLLGAGGKWGMKETFCVLNDMCIVCSDVKINCLVLGDLLVALTWGKFLSQFLGLKKASGDDEIKYYL